MIIIIMKWLIKQGNKFAVQDKLYKREGTEGEERVK